MSVRPYRDIDRRKSRQIHVGKVPVGGGAPITVQSMTNTLTHDVPATVAQIKALEKAGVDIVRVSCPDQESALALKDIVPQVEVPIVADIHFHYKRAIEAAESGAACLRINPGNIGRPLRCARSSRRPRTTAAPCASGSMPARSSASCWRNTASLAPRRWWRAPRTRPMLEDKGFFEFKISSKPPTCSSRSRLRGSPRPATIPCISASPRRAGCGAAASRRGRPGDAARAGIGDTIRVSLAADPIEEVRVGNHMLKSLGLRQGGLTFMACPTCARRFEVIKTVERVEKRLAMIQAARSTWP